jgi:hypothetical protein
MSRTPAARLTIIALLVVVMVVLALSAALTACVHVSGYAPLSVGAESRIVCAYGH